MRRAGDGVDGALVAYSLQDGRVRWQHQLPPWSGDDDLLSGASSMPLPVVATQTGGLILVARQPRPPDGSHVVDAYSAEDGSHRWTSGGIGPPAFYQFDSAMTLGDHTAVGEQSDRLVFPASASVVFLDRDTGSAIVQRLDEQLLGVTAVDDQSVILTFLDLLTSVDANELVADDTTCMTPVPVSPPDCVPPR